jgi:hypothetical protein
MRRARLDRRKCRLRAAARPGNRFGQDLAEAWLAP